MCLLTIPKFTIRILASVNKKHKNKNMLKAFVNIVKQTNHYKHCTTKP